MALLSDQCKRHQVVDCPRACWVEGRTLLSYFEGKRVWVRVFTSREAVEKIIAYFERNHELAIARYEELELPVPAQYTKWEYRIWDGSNEGENDE